MIHGLPTKYITTLSGVTDTNINDNPHSNVVCDMILLHCQESQTQTSMTSLTTMLSVIWSYYIVRSHRHKNQWQPHNNVVCDMILLHCQESHAQTPMTTLTAMLFVILSYYIVRSHIHKHQWQPSQQCYLWYDITTLSGVTDTNINDNPHNNVVCDMILTKIQVNELSFSPFYIFSFNDILP